MQPWCSLFILRLAIYFKILLGTRVCYNILKHNHRLLLVTEFIFCNNLKANRKGDG